MSINELKPVNMNKIIYSNNDRSDVVPACVTLYAMCKNICID